MVATSPRVKLADQVWLAVALLTREHPDEDGFRPADIIERVRREFGSVRPGHHAHISSHCVASRPAQPANLRMLTRTGDHLYRLYRPEDPAHPDRSQGRMSPGDLPERYRYLLDWYEKEYLAGAFSYKVFGPNASLLRLEPFDSGLTDISERHDHYLAEGLVEKWRDQAHPGQEHTERAE